jgi:hypothetical protein
MPYLRAFTGIIRKFRSARPLLGSNSGPVLSNQVALYAKIISKIIPAVPRRFPLE